MTYCIQITDTTQAPEKTRLFGSSLGKPRHYETEAQALAFVRQNLPRFLNQGIRLEVVEMIEE
jgi:hypothetical protein